MKYSLSHINIIRNNSIHSKNKIKDKHKKEYHLVRAAIIGYLAIII